MVLTRGTGIGSWGSSLGAVYAHKAGKVKGALYPPMAVCLMLYPTVLGFGLAARLGLLGLLIPTPLLPGTQPLPSVGSIDGLHGPHDMWETDHRSAIACTTFVFAAVFLVHMVLVLRLTAAGPIGSFALTCFAASLMPFTLWVCTTAYFIVYVTAARYGPHNGEWYAAAGVSFVIFTLTLILVGCPPSFDKVMLTDAHDPDLEAHVQPPQPPPHQE